MLLVDRQPNAAAPHSFRLKKNGLVPALQLRRGQRCLGRFYAITAPETDVAIGRQELHPVFEFMRNGSGKSTPIAAGTFGIDPASPQQPRHYHPAGCPSPDQFEARFRGANDRKPVPRTA